MALRFSKMHGAGNDFAVLDCRDSDALPDADTLRLMGHRHFGIGFDQLLTIEKPRSAGAAAAYRIINQDGSFAGQCGNGARCVAHWLVLRGVVSEALFALDSPAGLIRVSRGEQNRYTLNMGRPHFAPDDVPLVAEQASLSYQLPFDGHHITFSAVSMGNPHAVIQVESCFEAPVARWGQAVQASHVFPEGVNVGFAEIVTRKHIRLRVYERGVGETLACGSGACAAAVSLIRLGLVEPVLEVHLPGGVLEIEWAGDGADVLMTGPALLVYEGEWLND
jgi:diaminopimelate epimerase